METSRISLWVPNYTASSSILGDSAKYTGAKIALPRGEALRGRASPGNFARSRVCECCARPTIVMAKLSYRLPSSPSFNPLGDSPLSERDAQRLKCYCSS